MFIDHGVNGAAETTPGTLESSLVNMSAGPTPIAVQRPEGGRYIDPLKVGIASSLETQKTGIQNLSPKKGRGLADTVIVAENEIRGT